MVIHILSHDAISFVQSLGVDTDRCKAHDQSIIIWHSAQDVKEALLGGSLVSLILFFKIRAFMYLIVFLNYIFICNHKSLRNINITRNTQNFAKGFWKKKGEGGG